MADAMSPDRFRALADAYGGAVARWPEASRAAAIRVAEQSWARATLVDAESLDAALDDWALPPVDQALAVRLLASAPAKRRNLLGSARLWWSGLGLAAALAGTATGSVAIAALAPAQVVAEPATAFGDLGPEPLS